MRKLKKIPIAKIPIQSMAIVLGLILMVTFFSIASSNFLTPSNINNILLATMINGVLSVGALYVVVTGGIDVSIGTSMTFVSVMLGVFMNWWGMPAWMGIICGILTGAAVGLINGIMVTKMKITPFIATLGMQMATAGLAIVITDGTPIYFTQIQGYQNIALGSPFAAWFADLGIADYAINTGVIIMVILILARPQTTDNWQNTEIEGIDIMLAVDVSTSMLAEDLKPNRLEAAKQVASEFINGRPNDNIGLTIFAGESFTQCPLTVDHGVLLNLFNSIKGDIAQRGLIEDGTAIGMGIANAVTRLKDSKAKSKVIILLTDGSNNRGDISPLTAAEIAKQFGIRIYTIGVGTNGTAPYPMQTYAGTQYVNVPVEIDEKTLTEIAGTTNGNYFRATSNSKLKEVYQEIDKLEKTKLNVKEFSKREEEYQVFAWIAFFCILLELLLRNSVLKKIP